MIKYSIDKDSTGAVIITVDSLLGIFPVMWFKTWEDFMEFGQRVMELVKQHEPYIPDVYKQAFNESVE